MFQIQELYFLVAYIDRVLKSHDIDAFINKAGGINNLFASNANSARQQTISLLDNVIPIFKELSSSITLTQEGLTKKLDIDLATSLNNLNSIKNNIERNPSFGVEISNALVAELRNYKNKINTLIGLLKPFEIDFISTIEKEESIIEITFDGKVAIDDFGTAEHQMEDWALTIQGYARLLDANSEDFQIIGISKSSPTKFQIRTTIRNTGLIISILSSLLIAERNLLQEKLIVEQIKHMQLVDDNLHKEFVENAEEKISKKVDDTINHIVDEKMKEYQKPEGHGDIKNLLSRGVKNQYNFIVNGGNVTFYVSDGEIKKQIDSLERTKSELQSLKSTYEKQKVLTEKSESTEVQDNNEVAN